MTQADPHQMTDPRLAPILAALIVAFAPHVVRLPIWGTCWTLSLWSLALYRSRRNKPIPRRRHLLFFAFLGFGGGFLYHGGSLDSDACVTLLTVMAGLKPLETWAYRDKIICLFLAYFIVITNLFYSEALAMAAYMFGSVWLTTAVLIHLHRPGKPPGGNLRLSGELMVQALPFMIALFLIFPRIPGSLIGLTRSHAGISGFSDQLSPGAISRLSQDNSVAFRAQFDGEMPPQSQLYWRGVVFHIYDGRSWLMGFHRPAIRPLPVGRDAVRYTVTLEPHNEKWLFALEWPGERPRHSWFMSDATFISRQPITSRVIYSMTSYPDARLDPDIRPSPYLLQLPENQNPAAVGLAESWRSADPAFESIVNRALRYFGEQGFRYSLSPPLLRDNPIDDFLFRTRLGYCEHFATAFVFLMRAAGVPARVVGGYLGGEVNPYGGYLIVRQSQAHAWAEVWLAGKGWTRVDPTSVVYPERLNTRDRPSEADEEWFGFLSISDMGPFADIMRKALLGWDAINTKWTFYVMGFTFRDQQDLLESLGIRVGSFRVYLKALVLAIVILGMAMAGMILTLMWMGRARTDRVRTLYNRFCAKLAAAGTPRGPSQGPRDFARLAMSAHTRIASEIQEITDLYVRIRYGGQEGRRLIADLRKKVGRLRVRP